MTPNHEQLPIIRSNARRILINAGAGSGKTSTLVVYADERPDESMLYIAFNKAIQIEATAKFPLNVECRTTHSLAYPVARRLFGALTGAKLGNVRAYEIAQRLDLHPSMANASLLTLMRWMSSADEFVHVGNIPDNIDIDEAYYPGVVSAAKDIWKAMLNKDDLSIKMPHDGYLKVYQLSKPVIAGSKKVFSTILVDEYQDLNLVTLDLVKRQQTNLVYVGDTHQSIYGFRGAVNAITHIEADETYYLTYSYRFGQPIADLANSLLGYFTKNHRPLVGAGNCQDTAFTVDETKSYAVISRTNAALFEVAAGRIDMNIPYSFIGGVDSYKFSIILDAYYLWSNNPESIRDNFIRRFASYSQMAQIAKESKDRELAFLVKVVEAYRERIPELIDAIRARHVDVSKSDMSRFTGIFFMTAHKSKGLEFKQVVLTDDYAELVSDSGSLIHPDDIDLQEINVLYVAFTRAEEALAINRGLADFMQLITGQPQQDLFGTERDCSSDCDAQVATTDENPQDEEEWESGDGPISMEEMLANADYLNATSEQDDTATVAEIQAAAPPLSNPDTSDEEWIEPLDLSEQDFYFNTVVDESDYAAAAA